MKVSNLFAVMQMKLEEEARWEAVTKLLEKHEKELKGSLLLNTGFHEINRLLEKHQKEMDEAVVDLIKNTKPQVKKHGN